MKKMTKFLSLIMALCLTAALLPPVRAAAQEIAVNPSDTDGLVNALNTAKDGDTIILKGSCEVNDTGSNSQPWVIDKQVTIKGGNIYLRKGGILLGADVTFENLTLNFVNGTRNAIIANGHTLTLKNVTYALNNANQRAGREVHLFCGGVTGLVLDETPRSGNHGTIMIQGTTSLGNMYAGNISADGNASPSATPASILFHSDAVGSMGTVYACGALETPVDSNNIFDIDKWNPDPPTANTTKFPVTGAVDISLRNGLVRAVHGLTGGSTQAAVTFNGNDNLTYNVVLDNIASLSVQSGNFMPAAGSNFTGTHPNLTVTGGTLNLSNYDNDFAVGNFTGGGTLILGKEQTLNISGSVSGKTKVGIGSINSEGISGQPRNEYIYITAPENTDEGSFFLANPSNLTNIGLNYSEGKWVGSSILKTEIINVSMQVPPPVKTEDFIELDDWKIAIPLTVDYSDSTENFGLYLIAPKVRVNEKAAPLVTVGNDTEIYRADAFNLFFTHEDNSEIIAIEPKDLFNPVFADGAYKIEFTIPAAYMQSGQETTVTGTLIIGEDTPVNPPETPTVVSIKVNSTNHKTEYTVGDALSVAGLTIEATMSDGKTQEIPVTAEMVTGFDPTKAVEKQTLTITYGGKTATFDISIKEKSSTGDPEKPAATVDSIKVNSTTHKTEYTVGDALSVDKLTIEATMSDKTTKTVNVTAAMVTGFDSSKAVEKQTLTITYGGKTTTFDISIKEKSSTGDPEKPAATVDSIKVNSTAHKTEYTVGDALSVDKLTIEATMSDKTTKTVNVTAAMVTGFDSSKAVEKQTLTITYEGKTATFDISVKAKSTSETDYAVTCTRTYDGVIETNASRARPGETVTISTYPNSGYELDGIWVTDDDGWRVSLENTGGGRYRFTMPASRVYVYAEFTWIYSYSRPSRPSSSSSYRPYYPTYTPPTTVTTPDITIQPVPSPSAAAQVFRDIPSTYWAAGEIGWAYQSGYMTGTTAATFSPYSSTNHQQLWMVMARIFGNRPAGMDQAKTWAVKNGIASGDHPTTPITRQEMITALYQAAFLLGGDTATQAPLTNFADSGQISPASRNAMAWAVAKGILNGTSGGKRLDPEGTVTRAQFAVILYRFTQRVR